MEHPAEVDPPMDNAARCYQYTSSDDEDSRPAPTTDDRDAGKRQMARESSRAGAAPGESAQGPSTVHARLWGPGHRSIDDCSESLTMTTRKRRRPQP